MIAMDTQSDNLEQFSLFDNTPKHTSIMNAWDILTNKYGDNIIKLDL